MSVKKNPKTGKQLYKGMNDVGTRKNSNRALRKARSGPKSLDYMKPKKFRNYLTSSEMALFVPIDPRWLKRLEAEGRIPAAQRVPMGKLTIRLWSPEQAREIQRIIKGHQVGRPKGS